MLESTGRAATGSLIIAMIRFLFWNIARKPLQNLVANSVEEHEVDVLILGECEIPTGLLLEFRTPPESIHPLRVPQPSWLPSSEAASAQCSRTRILSLR